MPVHWSEIRRYPRGAGTVCLLRGESRLPAPSAVHDLIVRRRRWRVVVQEPAGTHILVETRDEDEAWLAYRLESDDAR